MYFTRFFSLYPYIPYVRYLPYTPIPVTYFPLSSYCNPEHLIPGLYPVSRGAIHSYQFSSLEFPILPVEEFLDPQQSDRGHRRIRIHRSSKALRWVLYDGMNMGRVATPPVGTRFQRIEFIPAICIGSYPSANVSVSLAPPGFVSFNSIFAFLIGVVNT
jgi:hypothetical protein